MRISSDDAAIMFDQNKLAKIFDIIANKRDCAIGRHDHWRARLGNDIDTIIVDTTRRGAKFGDDFTLNRPTEPARP